MCMNWFKLLLVQYEHKSKCFVQEIFIMVGKSFSPRYLVHNYKIIAALFEQADSVSHHANFIHSDVQYSK